MAQTLINAAADVRSNKADKKKGSDEGGDLTLNIDTRFEANLTGKSAGFMFGVMSDDGKKFKGVNELLPGLWTPGGDPVSNKAQVKMPTAFDNCTVQLFQAAGAKRLPGQNEPFLELQNCTLSAFVLNPAAGNTCDLFFKVFAPDVTGKTSGEVNDLIKGTVFIKVIENDLPTNDDDGDDD